ncbi:variant erythrocyte surface antigen-1 family protein [Babesia caballi]|uniref:Variant erythrocyte surface antigen-1 family protein n=1 Tax=Babesia caballi TaxID=5871 RepID=A0AAV4LND2_BABCB|nr:variant erythrocyte surface antigen-1 family protein [Babesia caballi]
MKMSADNQKKNSLKDPPKDLKEAIDWITWFCNYGEGSRDMRKQLGSAVSNLTNFQTKFNGRFGKVSDPEGLIGNLGKGFQSFLGYYGTASIGEEGIAQSGVYQSTYKDASWPNDVGQQKDCAKVFLGTASMAFYGLSFLYWQCSNSQSKYWASDKLNGNGSALSIFMSVAGFTSVELNSMQGSLVAERLTREPDGFSELKNVSPSPYSYSAFIVNLENSGPEKGINSPLTNCYVLAKEYFRDRFQKGETIDGALTSIKEALKKFSSLCYSYSYLQYEINNFMSAYMPDPSSPNRAAFLPNPPPPVPSPAPSPPLA